MANEMRLIDANKFNKMIEHVPMWGGVASYMLEHFPTVDAKPVVHGRWIGTHDGWYYSYSCSECGEEALTKEGTMHDQVCSAYCPNCGADMRKNKED